MSNILTSLFYWKDEETKALYQDMTNVAVDSFRGKLAGDWEFRKIDYGQLIGITHHDEAFYKCFLQLYEWWEQAHNVYYINVDLVCVKPIEIFGKFKELTMHWPTAQPVPGEPFNWNCGTLYIPRETKRETWQAGFDAYKEYFDSGEKKLWAADQDVYNEMLRSQGLPDDHYKNNVLHYLDHPAMYNEIGKDEAAILHFLSTRDKYGTIEKMRRAL